MQKSSLAPVLSFIDGLERKKLHKAVFMAAFAAYVILLAVISYFHEPWFDEAQAWQIARCASLHDILFKIPHYEGHPQLWHLILLPFAKTGMPYEFSLSLVNIIFSAAAAYVLMFRTKLPDLLRLALPFTYFMFYQYGVISRPYSVMTLAFMLCAAFYNEKNEKPVRMALSLALLCLSSAYGIAIAGSICIVWIIELWNGKNIFAFIKEFVFSKVFFCMLALLCLALLLLVMIWPAPDSNQRAATSTKGSFLSGTVYALFILMYDATIGIFMDTDDAFCIFEVISPALLYIIPIAVLIWGLLICYAKKHGKALLLVIPFLITSFLIVNIQFFAHHIGIATVYIIFVVCVCADAKKEETEKGGALAIDRAFTVFLLLFAAVQIVWSLMSAVKEIKYNYNAGKEIAVFAEENGLENTVNVAYMTVQVSDDKDGIDELYTDTGDGFYEKAMFNYSPLIIASLPYLDENIYDNQNFRKKELGYCDLRTVTDREEYDYNMEYLRSLVPPDYIIGDFIFSYSSEECGEKYDNNTYIYGKLLSFIDGGENYVPCAYIDNGRIFKGNINNSTFTIYKLYKKPETSEQVVPEG